MAMADVGVKIEPGSGVGAAQAYWRRSDAVQKKRVARSEVVNA
jgi:alanine-glyoxylate transaminase/serine-glyoxylate transaminase/serine-pyruvate transaminase